MAIVIDLAPELEARFRVLAAQRGHDPAEYARFLIERNLQERPEPLTGDSDSEEPEDPDALDRAIATILQHTPEQIAAAQAHTIATYRPRTPPPPGTNGMERVYGHWPGDETDEEIFRALEELS